MGERVKKKSGRTRREPAGAVLYQKYRPASLDDVVGQDAAVKAARGVLERGGSRAFILGGPSGVGKTTMARIMAGELGCRGRDLLEVDAATHTGVEAMRNVQEVLRYKPFGDSSGRAVVVDECHAVSRQAWQSLLKIVEEPPPHVSWFFCTTEPAKVPKTIRTRCTELTLRPVAYKDLSRLLRRVCKREEIDLRDDVADLVTREADGSPRQLLVNLAVCRDAETKKEAAAALRTAHESEPALELCKFLIKGGSWKRAAELVAEVDSTAESVRIVVCNYIAGAARRAKSDREACHLLSILEHFSEPYGQGDQNAQLLLSVGRVLYDGDEE